MLPVPGAWVQSLVRKLTSHVASDVAKINVPQKRVGQKFFKDEIVKVKSLHFCSQGWGSLVGCRLWGRTESDTIEAT